MAMVVKRQSREVEIYKMKEIYFPLSLTLLAWCVVRTGDSGCCDNKLIRLVVYLLSHTMFYSPAQPTGDSAGGNNIAKMMDPG